MIYKIIFNRNLLLLPILFFCLDIISANNDSLVTKPKILIAKVADREITLDDFLSRSEYTIRPAYCKGNTNIDKKIVLNSLIAEKILSFQPEIRNKLLQNEMFTNLIQGRREQKMRALLSYYEGDKNVKIDTNEIKRVYSTAGRTYKVEYFNISDPVLAIRLNNKYSKKDSSFQKIYSNLSIRDSIRKKEVSWYSKDSRIIHQALFSKMLKKNQMIGPINIDDTTHLFIKIGGWDDKLAIKEQDITNRWNDVEEELAQEKADSLYDKFVLGIMAGKQLSFNAGVFNKVVKLMAPSYTNQKSKAEDEFMSLEYNKNVESNDKNKIGDDYNEIKNEPLFTIDKKIWTVSDFYKEMDKHPIVLRKNDFKKKFALRLRNAIADLIRDKYLTDLAYQRGYNNDEIVSHYEQIWTDAGIAFFQKTEFLKNFDVKDKRDVQIIENFLNPVVEQLLKKYSDQIEINVEEYDKIKLTRIDMFTTQEQVPYPVYVPPFPQLTNYNKLDYGKKMNVGADRK